MAERSAGRAGRGNPRLRSLLIVGLLVAGAGCASVPADKRDARDPWEAANRPLFAVAEGVDRGLVRPLARGYRAVVPRPVRAGVSNFFSNLADIDAAVNALLQGKPRAALQDVGRVFINTTLGLGGLLDPATPSGLESSEEDLGQTLAVWGVGAGPYLYLPVLGPVTLRDTPRIATQLAIPSVLFDDSARPYAVPLQILSGRADALDLTDARDASALDRYAFTREAYLQRRRFDIDDGAPPAASDEFDDLLDEFDDELDDEPDAPESPR
ncbi:MAG: VacJ family lipoprotein [Pseudomonadota bacterium]